MMQERLNYFTNPSKRTVLLKLNLINTKDPGIVDTTGATYPYYDPLKIKHIKLAQEKGLGIANPKIIDLIEVKIWKNISAF